MARQKYKIASNNSWRSKSPALAESVGEFVINRLSHCSPTPTKKMNKTECSDTLLSICIMNTIYGHLCGRTTDTWTIVLKKNDKTVTI